MMMASPASSTVASQPCSFLHASILTPHGILTDLTRFAAVKSERTHAAMAREDGAFHPIEKPDRAQDAVARVPLAASARARADVEIFEQHRIAELQHLGIGEPRVGHVGVHRVGAGEAGARRRA